MPEERKREKSNHHFRQQLLAFPDPQLYACSFSLFPPFGHEFFAHTISRSISINCESDSTQK